MTERSHEKAAGSAVEEVAIHALPDGVAMVMIDVQRGFDYPNLGRRSNPEAEENSRVGYRSGGPGNGRPGSPE